MKIAGVQLELEEEAFDIFLSGCDGKCKGCHNKELQNYTVGTDYRESEKYILTTIRNIDHVSSLGGIKVRYIRLLGGEPLLQDIDELMDLVDFLEKKFTKELVLYTRFCLNDIPKNIREHFSYIKTGEFLDDLPRKYKTEYKFKVLYYQKINKRGIDY